MTYRRDLASSVSKLDSLSPLKVLERGYSIVMKDGHTVSRTDEISNDDLISIRISDGNTIFVNPLTVSIDIETPIRAPENSCT